MSGTLRDERRGTTRWDDADEREAARGMTDTAIFARYVTVMLRIGQADPESARVAIEARRDQVMSTLKDALRPGTTDSERMVALTELYLHATLEMLYLASRAEDRIVFAEAEMKAWAVARALDRAVDAALEGDRDTAVAAMMAAESVLGINLTSLEG